VSKFKARCLDSLLEFYEINNALPKVLTFSLSSLIAFYTHKGSDRDYVVNDSQSILDFFDNIKDLSNNEIIFKILSNCNFWGKDLTKVPNLYDTVLDYYNNICANGMACAVIEVTCD
jgi:tagaturonate reductase